MKSAGNDIVALNAIDIQRTILPAFYSKFITPIEQELYRQPQFAVIPFQNFIWLLWSVKESAYKSFKRHQHDLVFSPSKIIIQAITIPPVTWEKNNDSDIFFTGEVISGAGQLHFFSKITHEFIASVVNDNATFEHVYWDIKQIEHPNNENQSNQVREFALKKLTAVLNISDLSIDKNPAGIPIIRQGKNELDIPVSLAHHGHFVGYSFNI